MEKSLKLTNNHFSLSDINLDSFSSSKDWIGYFERETKFSFNQLNESIDLFTAFFDRKHKDFIIMTALAFDDEAQKNSKSNKYQPLFDELKNNNILMPMTKNFEDYLYGEIKFPIELLQFHFDKNIFVNLSKLLMCHSGVIGQVCFYINTQLNVAVYPHDDTGFGCIALNGDTNVGVDFLRFCKEKSNFNVVIFDK